MPRPELGTLVEGQEVVIIDPSYREPRRFQATVGKIGRDWVTFEGTGDYTNKTWRLRKSTQTNDNKVGVGGLRFRTLEQHAWEEGQAAARRVLQDVDLMPTRGIWADDDERLVALAAYVLAYDAAHPIETKEN